MINDTTPVATTAISITPEEQQSDAIDQAQDSMMEIDGAHALQPTPPPALHHHQQHSGLGDAAAAIKKSFIRKKEMTNVEEGGKKQKAKVSNTRK